MGTTTPAPPTTADGRPSPVASHIAALDGVRGLAVAAVVAYHLDLLSGGFLGVDVFFVLSGFLITSLLLSELGGTGTVSLRRFWVRRIRRLVPAVAVVVPATLVAALVLDWPRTRLGSAVIDGFATLTWWANWRQAGGTSYWAADHPNLFRHAWSLAIEEQFYLVWPLAVVVAAALAHRWGRSVVAAVGVTAAIGFAASSTWLVVLSRRLDDGELSRAYVGTDTRVLAPLAGCALACWLARGSEGGASVRRGGGGSTGPLLAALGVAGLGGLAWAVVAADVASPTLYRSGGFVLVALAAVAVVAMVVVGSPGGVPGTSARWATLGVLRYLGLRSYGIYLWSWPLQVLAEHRFTTAPRAVLVVAVVVASLVIAELSFRLVEDPIRRRSSWTTRPALRRPAVRVPALVAAVTLPFLVLVAVDATAEEPPVHERLDTDDALTEATAPPPERPPPTEEPPGPSAATDAPAEPSPETDVPPDTAAPDVPPEPLYVMVIGDSIAFTTVYYLEVDPTNMPEGIASVDGRGIIGCGVLAADGWAYRMAEGFDRPAGEACAGQREAEATGLSGSPDVVLAMPGGWESVDVRSPDGRVVEARSPEMADVLAERLGDQARAAHEVGAAFGLVQWACPGSEATPEARDPRFATWMNATIERIAEEARAEGVDAFVIEVDEAVCVDGDAAGEPTAGRIAATGDETHVVDSDGARWFWNEWVGPAIVDHMS